METDYILTSLKIEEEYYECPCGCTIGGIEGYDIFYVLSGWKYCPKCGEKRVEYITEEQAVDNITFSSWFKNIDWGEYKDEKGLDYSSLEWDYRNDHRYNKVWYRSFDDFKKLIDKACERAKNFIGG